MGMEDDMKLAEKTRRIQSILDHLYPTTPIPLDHRCSYSLLIAVLLSAQTTDKKVNEVTPGLFELADNPQDMALQQVEEIWRRIRVLGLARTKAKNIKRLSEILIETYDGVVPADMTALESLPGVGHKTASVVMAQAFLVPTFPVDTHIHRLAWRWGLSSGRNVVHTERDLKRHFDESVWNKLHLQIIYFGRQYCPARGHVYEDCPVCSWGGIKKRLKQESKEKRAGPFR